MTENKPVSIKLLVIDNDVTNVYYHANVYNADKVLETLKNLCNPTYVYDYGFYGESIESVKNAIGCETISLLDEFVHFTNEEAKILSTVAVDYEFKWYKN